MDSYLTGWNVNDMNPSTSGERDMLQNMGDVSPLPVPPPCFSTLRERCFDALGQNGVCAHRALIDALRFQRTIARVVEIRGFGFWTGEDIRLEFRPAPKHSGVCFVRTDLPGAPRIPARVGLRENKPRQTSLSTEEARVDMIEHLLAALAALKIDNCDIHLDRPEIPGMDGSCAPFFRVLKSAGTMFQSAIRPMRVVVEPFRIEEGSSFLEVKPLAAPATVYRYCLDYGGRSGIGRQEFSFALSEESFERDVMTSRTFLLKKEADHLLSLGLCRRVTPADVLVFDDDGPIGNALRFENECARHKVLDMVGDFALAPCDWIGEFYGHFSGHHLNARCVGELDAHTVLLDENAI